MIIVTGAAGFIGSNIIQGLNQAGVTDIIAIDNLTNGHQYINLAACRYADYLDAEDFLLKVKENKNFADSIKAIIHQGACSTTTEWNGRYMMQNNYEYTKQLFHYCLDRNIQFIYASSGAVYGGNCNFSEKDMNQKPLNVYGYSKWQFDNYMLRFLPRLQSQVVGLRYFNVYGPYEQHKGSMASVAFHFMNQLRESNEVKLFEASHGYGNGEHRRDFVFVGDVVKVVLWFLANPRTNGVFNVGTGKARPFNDIAKILIKIYGSGQIRYIPFPEKLKQAYQAFTEADISALRQAGYQESFTSLEEGLTHYFNWYQNQFLEPNEVKVFETIA